MRITNLTDWKLAGYWPYAPLQSESMETGMTLIPQTPWIDAKVPGSVQKDLLAAGLIEDPYYEMNSIKAEWVENRFWVYKTTFTVPEEHRRTQRTEDHPCFRGHRLYRAHLCQQQGTCRSHRYVCAV